MSLEMNIFWLAFLGFLVALGIIILVKSKAFMKIWGFFGLLFTTVMGFFASVLFQSQTCSRPLLSEDEDEDEEDDRYEYEDEVIGWRKKMKEMMAEKKDEGMSDNYEKRKKKKKMKMMRAEEEDEDMSDDDISMEYDNISIWQAMENVRKKK